MSDTELIPVLNGLGEFFAAGFMEGEGVPTVLRAARAIRNHLSRCPLPDYRGETFYPFSRSWCDTGSAVCHNYVQIRYDPARLEQKRGEVTTTSERDALDALRAFWQDYPSAPNYTHSIPHYDRVLREGLDGYAERIQARASGGRAPNLYEALLIVLDGVRDLHGRMVARIEEGAYHFFGKPEDPADWNSVKSGKVVLVVLKTQGLTGELLTVLIL